MTTLDTNAIAAGLARAEEEKDAVKRLVATRNALLPLTNAVVGSQLVDCLEAVTVQSEGSPTFSRGARTALRVVPLCTSFWERVCGSVTAGHVDAVARLVTATTMNTALPTLARVACVHLHCLVTATAYPPLDQRQQQDATDALVNALARLSGAVPLAVELRWRVDVVRALLRVRRLRAAQEHIDLCLGVGRRKLSASMGGRSSSGDALVMALYGVDACDVVLRMVATTHALVLKARRRYLACAQTLMRLAYRHPQDSCEYMVDALNALVCAPPSAAKSIATAVYLRDQCHERNSPPTQDTSSQTVQDNRTTARFNSNGSSVQSQSGLDRQRLVTCLVRKRRLHGAVFKALAEHVGAWLLHPVPLVYGSGGSSDDQQMNIGKSWGRGTDEGKEGPVRMQGVRDDASQLLTQAAQDIVRGCLLHNLTCLSRLYRTVRLSVVKDLVDVSRNDIPTDSSEHDGSEKGSSIASAINCSMRSVTSDQLESWIVGLVGSRAIDASIDAVSGLIKFHSPVADDHVVTQSASSRQRNSQSIRGDDGPKRIRPVLLPSRSAREPTRSHSTRAHPPEQTEHHRSRDLLQYCEDVHSIAVRCQRQMDKLA